MPPGVVLVPHTEHGQLTVIDVPAEGVSRLPLSSTARVLVVPVAGCQLAPPSVETSTPATVPPTSLAVPLIVTDAPSATLPPGAGEVIADDGAVVSVDAVAIWIPEIGVAGCAPMSANRLTVACCMVTSTALPVVEPSRPHAHWTVPAPNTSAPLA